MPPETQARACRVFAALSHPVRLRIVQLVTEGDRKVGEIAEAMEISQSMASQHLAVLTKAGVLRVTARGNTRLYGVRGPRMGKILTIVEEFVDVHRLYGDHDIVEEGS